MSSSFWPAIYFGDLVPVRRFIHLEPGARQGHAHARREIEVAAVYIRVLDHQLRAHFGNNVIEIRAVGHIRQPFFVILADLRPVVTMHVLDIKPIAVAPPNLVKYLVPFLDRVYLGNHPGGRDVFTALIPLRVRIQDGKGARGRRHELRAVARDRVSAGRREKRGLFTVF